MSVYAEYSGWHPYMSCLIIWDTIISCVVLVMLCVHVDMNVSQCAAVVLSFTQYHSG